MPTYLNPLNIPIAIGLSYGRTKILKMGETFETTDIFDDQYPLLVRISDEPYDNPVLDRKTFEGEKDDEFTLPLIYKYGKIQINVNGCIDLYLNSLSNSPPITITNSYTLELKNKFKIDKLCFVFLQDSKIDIYFMRE
jgi:hypothetical protein